MADIETLLRESRSFPPPAAFREKAHVSSNEDYERLYRESLEDPERFWGEAARELHWFKPWDKVLDWKAPHAKWFVGGKTNLAYNCLDRHLATWRRNKAAIIWEGEPGDRRTLTYNDLHREVAKFADVLASWACARATASGSTCPWCPSSRSPCSRCARIGAMHSVVFGGFSAEALVDRMNDAAPSS